VVESAGASGVDVDALHTLSAKIRHYGVADQCCGAPVG
jgi:hypothetical protein